MSDAPRIYYCEKCDKYWAKWEVEKPDGRTECDLCGWPSLHEQSLSYQLDEIRERLKRLEKTQEVR